jgi:hypothetical protein
MSHQPHSPQLSGMRESFFTKSTQAGMHASNYLRYQVSNQLAATSWKALSCPKNYLHLLSADITIKPTYKVVYYCIQIGCLHGSTYLAEGRFHVLIRLVH